MFTGCIQSDLISCVLSCLSERIKSLFSVIYSDRGSIFRDAEEQAYLFFVDFLDACKGKVYF